MSVDLKPCPWCMFEHARVDECGPVAEWWVACPNCGAGGPLRDTAQEAVDRWNNAGLRSMRANLEAASTRAAQAEADLSALAATVGVAVVASALAPGESLSAAPQHIIVSTVNRLRARAEAAEAEVARLRAELAQARADALVLAGHWFGSRGGFFLAPVGIEDVAEIEALTAAGYRADDLPPGEMLAIVRRALVGAR